ncbi:MAG: glutamine synthetase type III, partial [Synergistales bacterium]|nr:glutamine synthetase type III [Synergistales bacterium]
MYVFDRRAMKERLPQHIFEALMASIEGGQKLDSAMADMVAAAMKEWALSKGATHWTHWFHPRTEMTAEKHMSFMSKDESGMPIESFKGKELIQSEPDASSLPSGGIRSTFEARGYSAWDPSSPAFIMMSKKGGTLCIPSVFISYDGTPLDLKTPLLKAVDAVETRSMRLLKLFGNRGIKWAHVTVGAEQEYFLVDSAVAKNRLDIRYCGRTILGCPPPKGQQMEDHYFGSIKIRVSAYMKELNEELWKLGVLSKTEHNEVAPAQHELAPIFSTANVACDHNQIMMEIMRKVAKRHGLTCLLHEKPFAGVNGSGKHNNWSISTDKGVNLLDPGSTPEENAQFLTFFCAVIKAVDSYPELLRISVATAANDHRLGANEAPPAVVSVFIGEELESILTAIETGARYDKCDKGNIEIGVDTLPSFPKDMTDRNRTSPFAFTGNRFEFRMPGSSISIAGANTMLNTIVADSLRQFADELEGAEDFSAALNDLIKRTFREHRRVIFNGNGYDDKWLEEAEKRGLPNLRSSAEAIPHLLDKKNVEVLTRSGVFTKAELSSRFEIMLEAYCKSIRIEALTML